MSIESWEREVAVYLRTIESASERIENATREIHHALLVLKSRPDFETRAQAALEGARTSLDNIMTRLGESAARYEQLPVPRNQENSHAVQAS
jgi:hypothetical protein